MKDKNSSKQTLGRQGEDLAARYLEKAGLKIITRNYRCPKGEMDIIARSGEWYVFVEVRSKTSGVMGYGEESISQRKAQRLKNVTAYYCLEKGFTEWPPLRIDIIAIVFSDKLEPEVKWIQNAL